MKKLMAVFVLLMAGIVAAAVWYSPFAGRNAIIYRNNAPVCAVDGFCYAPGQTVRLDIEGGEDALYAALGSLRALPVRRVEADGLIVVYAKSDRVSEELYLSDGKSYNVMVALRDGHIAIGAPLLAGSY